MNLKIVLIEPQNPGNIGAICRIMANFSLNELFIINPKCDINDIEAVKRAKHAKPILENIQLITYDELYNNDLTIGTTAIVAGDRNIARTPINISDFTNKISEYKDTDYSIAIVFGREGEGLHNSELEKMDYNITIPSNREYQTLNLSQSVAIICYELFKAFGKEHMHYYVKNRKYAERETKDNLIKKFEEISELIEYETDEQKTIREQVFNKIVNKSNLTNREAFAFFGLLKNIKKKFN